MSDRKRISLTPRRFLCAWLAYHDYELAVAGRLAGDVLTLAEEMPREKHAENELGAGGFTGRRMTALVVATTPHAVFVRITQRFDSMGQVS